MNHGLNKINWDSVGTTFYEYSRTIIKNYHTTGRNAYQTLQ
jgi:hypothetical protein